MTSARQGRNEIRWTPRVPKAKIRRLYEADAQGIVDQELLDDVGTTLFARCQDILTIKAARMGHVRCDREASIPPGSRRYALRLHQMSSWRRHVQLLV